MCSGHLLAKHFLMWTDGGTREKVSEGQGQTKAFKFILWTMSDNGPSVKVKGSWNPTGSSFRDHEYSCELSCSLVHDCPDTSSCIKRPHVIIMCRCSTLLTPELSVYFRMLSVVMFVMVFGLFLNSHIFYTNIINTFFRISHWNLCWNKKRNVKNNWMWYCSLFVNLHVLLHFFCKVSHLFVFWYGKQVDHLTPPILFPV